MAKPRKLPDNGTLLHWVEDEHLTHQQCADRIYAETGEHVARSAVSAALSRAGVARQKARYQDTLPWRVKVNHLKEYPARMLRLLGRRRAGSELSENESQRLDSWLRMLADENAVVGYDPDNAQQGFHYIDPQGDDGKDGIPIHRQKVRTQPLA